ncbi:hypothetical protein K7432_013538 [Basidiobolus ranarum]|uniref:FCP1 homology domain-containing protein n=1 Tax=Basidiobolus ranarum TaxID=34480 RepID=A0ABR2WJ11_9FUNG
MAENLITQVSPTELTQSGTLSSDTNRRPPVKTALLSRDKKLPRSFKNRMPFSLFSKPEAKVHKPRFGFLSKLFQCVRGAPPESKESNATIKKVPISKKQDTPEAVTNKEVSAVAGQLCNEKSPNAPPLQLMTTTEQPDTKALLPPLAPEHIGKKCLVLDLDETLIHSSFKLVENADIVVPVDIEGQIHNVYALKRPGVDEFLRRVADTFEVVIFTASLSKYADPVLDLLDIHKTITHRLFRESCYNHCGNYVKDLSQLGRDIRHVMIVDNSPASYLFHPSNAVPISSWFNDPHDTELLDLIPVLEDLALVDNVMIVLDNASDHP